MNQNLARYMMPAGVIIFCLITLACILLSVVIRYGMINSPLDFPARYEFIQQNLLIWQLTWLNWMAAAMGLFLFACMLSTFVPHSFLKIYALALMGLGIVPDISAETILAFVLPYAHQIGETEPIVRLLENIAIQLSGFIGNGFYNVGGLILNILLFQNAKLPRRILQIGIPAWFFGIALSFTTAIQDYFWGEVCAGVAMAWSTLWILAVSFTIFKNYERYQP
ncbi:hypothetical protein [Algicola sagamiensis]|uniref:hypothetical protein n=1 Tax=Algicola sagamiensis TaxID=163869 RepID=UPI0012FA2B91|nr:hypothetical protein [Algicola sagamiensis]